MCCWTAIPCVIGLVSCLGSIDVSVCLWCPSLLATSEVQDRLAGNFSDSEIQDLRFRSSA